MKPIERQGLQTAGLTSTSPGKDVKDNQNSLTDVFSASRVPQLPLALYTRINATNTRINATNQEIFKFNYNAGRAPFRLASDRTWGRLCKAVTVILTQLKAGGRN